MVNSESKASIPTLPPALTAGVVGREADEAGLTAVPLPTAEGGLYDALPLLLPVPVLV